jgi:hypothetical protein
MLSETPDGDRTEYVLPETSALYAKDPQALSRMIQDHFTACGVRTVKPGTGEGTDKWAVAEVGFHSLRHTFVSLCRQSNAPLSVVEAIVGHSNPAMTRHSAHVSELAAASAVHALPAIMGDTTNTKALPPAGTLVDAASVRALAERLTPHNAAKVKAELPALAG